MPDPNIPDGCDDCPNRAMKISDRQRGKWGSYLFALILSVFLAYQAWSHEKRGEPIPVMIWFPTLILTGTALGVQIDPEYLGRLLGSK